MILDQFVSDDRLSDEIHTNGYTQIHTDEQTHTHKHTPYKHLHAHKRHTAYIHPHTHTHSRTSTYNQTHTSPTHTDPYAFYLSRLSLPHAHSSALYVCSFNLSKLFPCGVIRSYNFCGFQGGRKSRRPSLSVERRLLDKTLLNASESHKRIMCLIAQNTTSFLFVVEHILELLETLKDKLLHAPLLFLGGAEKG